MSATGRRVVGVLAVQLSSVGLLGLALATPGAVVAERGRRVFMEQGCHGCHTIGAVGTPIGPDLSRIGNRYSVSDLRRWLRDPESVRPGAHMPILELTEDQIDDLAEFLGFLR